MKKITLRSLSLAVIATLAASGLYAQTPIVTPLGVTARLADQLTVTKTSDIDFGGIFIPTSADVVVTMDYKGVVTVTTGTTSLYSTNLQKRGQLKVEADQASTFTIDYPTSVNINNGSNTLLYTPQLYEVDGTAIARLNAKNYSANQSGGENQGFEIEVAGTLGVPAVAIPGIYTGAVNVTVTWQ